LILSEFTGSASVFKGHELSVNPWDYRKCAEAIKAALEMGAEEREQRWLKLNEAVMHHTAAHWFATFMEHLEKVWSEHALRDTISVPRLSINKLCDQYQKRIGGSSSLIMRNASILRLANEHHPHEPRTYLGCIERSSV
jgi:trehalose 6-phosphate synthase/phosphatase